MVEEQHNEAEVEKVETFEIHGAYGFLDCLFVIDILALSALKWLRRPGFKNDGIRSMETELCAIRTHVREIKKHIRDLTIETLGGAYVQEAKHRHSLLWRIVLRLLKEIQTLK